MVVVSGFFLSRALRSHIVVDRCSVVGYVVTHKFPNNCPGNGWHYDSSVIGILSFQRLFKLGVPLIFLVAVLILLFNRRERSVRWDV